MSRKGLFLPQLAEDSDELGREFLESPTAFAKRYGLDPDNLECPAEAHAAIERGNRFSAAVNDSKLAPTDESMPQLKRLASESFGDDYLVSTIPFGLRFRERANLLGADLTATGSGTITWLDGDADVDG